MDNPIKNSWELREEIIRLRALEEEQAAAIKERFSSPAAAFSAVYSLFPKPAGGGSRTNIFNQDFVSILSRFLLPLTLNKTLFRKSGFIVKTLVGLVSQKASGYINEDSVVGLWDKVKALFHKKGESVKQNYPYGL
ncbi:MAG: hypothetical protein ACTHNW_02680 [Mucilaginibacter sp.]